MRRKLLVSLVAGSLLFPPEATSAPCAGFTDVDSANPFCADVAWVKNRGITLGCTAGPRFCPNDAVTRLQMATFLYRMGNVTVQLGGNATGSTARLGTTDSQPVEIIANHVRGLRIEPHLTSPNVIGGNAVNNATVGTYAATVAGGGASMTIVGSHTCALAQGCANVVTDAAGTVGGGAGNQAGDGDSNPTNNLCATVAGGTSNLAGHHGATVGGGINNRSANLAATVGGGFGNYGGGAFTAIGGGTANQANAEHGTVAGGSSNRADGNYSAVAGGFANQAVGSASFVAGGSGNHANGSNSFAAGRNARANQSGCFVVADASSANATNCFSPNEFIARALGGFFFYTGGTSDSDYSGATLGSGAGAWGVYSDRNGKEAVADVDPEDVLQRLSKVKVSTWRWKNEPNGIRHMGPMAQDFHEAFALGGSDKQIVTVDADGVALAAIQGVNAKLEARLAAKDAEVAALKAELDSLRESVDALRAALSELARQIPVH
jgi:hypothetical protein